MADGAPNVASADLIPLAQKIHSCADTRYFMIKSFNNENIGRSLQHQVWATSSRNERSLGAAFESAPFIVLVFSVNSSSRFSGYALMTCRPGESQSRRDVFCGNDGRPFPGRCFDVKWIRHHEVFFRDTEHIVNPLNEYKAVKIGRDGQELSREAGQQLCGLIDEHYYNTRRNQSLRIEEEYVAADGPITHGRSAKEGPKSESLLVPRYASAGRPHAPADTAALRKRHEDNPSSRGAADKRLKLAAEDNSSASGALVHLRGSGFAQLASLAAALKAAPSKSSDSSATSFKSPPTRQVVSHGVQLGGVAVGGIKVEVKSEEHANSSSRSNQSQKEASSSSTGRVDDFNNIGAALGEDSWETEIFSDPSFSIFPLDLTTMDFPDYEELCAAAENNEKQLEVQNQNASIEFPLDQWLDSQVRHFGTVHPCVSAVAESWGLCHQTAK